MELAKVCADEDKLKTALEHIEKVYSSHSTQFYYTLIMLTVGTSVG